MSSLSYLEKLLDGVEVEWQPLGELAENLDSMRRPITSGLREAGLPLDLQRYPRLAAPTEISRRERKIHYQLG